MRRQQAYNAPPPGYQHPQYTYRLTFKRGDDRLTTGPIKSPDLQTRSRALAAEGWEYVCAEQVPE